MCIRDRSYTHKILTGRKDGKYMARFTNQAQLRYGNNVANSNIAVGEIPVSYTHLWAATILCKAEIRSSSKVIACRQLIADHLAHALPYILVHRQMLKCPSSPSSTMYPSAKASTSSSTTAPSTPSIILCGKGW